MYSRPHLICVAASVCQSGPALAILEPGRACGMPYAPSGFAAVTLQPLSCAHSGSRQENWLDDQPNEPSIASAICCGEPEGAVTVTVLAVACACCAGCRACGCCACACCACACLRAAVHFAVASRACAARSWYARWARVALAC